MTLDDASRSIAATLAGFGLAETALAAIDGRDVGATLARPTTASGSPTSGLPLIAVAGADAGTAPAAWLGELLARGELGRGGMGLVQLAEQRSLGRLVAVKTARGTDEGVRRALLREARTMGSLEHPAIVPVHALGVDASGSPVLVMKRVEGLSWRALLDAPEHDAWAPLVAGHGDRMRANVEILAQVARALAFAHDRGVVHRDLKPDNVMIGRFGEVYLLDWGLALRLSERDREPDGIVGTPGYLAPEMAHGRASEVDERTDVYLLGGTLFELLTGRMPHHAPTALAALASALLGEAPALPETAPSDLADLVRRALASDPAARPSSAEAFRAGLAAHLVSHEADILIERADALLSGLDASPATEGPLAMRTFLEARFALRAALDLRPGDPRAIERLDRCTTRMIERELARRSPAGARDLLPELSRARPDLLAAIDALESAQARERGALEGARRARADADISTAFPVMAAMAVVLTLIASPFLLSTGLLASTPAEALVANGGVAALIVMGVFLGRRRVLATPGARRITSFMALWALSQVPATLIELALGMEVHRQALGLTAGLVVAAAGALLVLDGLWAAVVLHLAAIAACLHWPEREVAVIPPFVLLNLAVIVLALRRRAREQARDEGSGASLPAEPRVPS